VVKYGNVESYTKVIKGVDGNDITLYISKPKDAKGPVPCIFHTHGGGMVVLQASCPLYHNWRNGLASKGLVVVGVEFRNATSVETMFPAGLNDCFSGLEWTFQNKSELGISKIVTSGESGGGNLSIALVLKAKKEGKLDMIQGNYALCPYIAGPSHYWNATYTSMTENDKIFLGVKLMAVLSECYAGGPGSANEQDPLAWPINATVADLTEFPPCCISANELDPLRDEGLEHFRKLTQAGVSVYSRTLNGTTHGADVFFMAQLPEVANSTLRDIKSFCDEL
jgi:acetyl esterase/lipase